MYLKIYLFIYFIFNATLIKAQVDNIHHTRVIWTKNPAHEAVISWHTLNSHQINEVMYSKDKLSLYSDDKNFRQNAFYSKKISQADKYVQHVHLKNLEADQIYYFVARSGNNFSKKFFFITAPNKQKKFNIIFGGDSRSDRDNRQNMNHVIRRVFEEYKAIAFCHGGDFVANGFSWSQWNDWLDDYEKITTTKGQLLPLIPTRGNHEFNSHLFNEIFAWPGEGFVYYTVAIQNMSLIVLNTEISIAGQQKKWLEDELKKAKKSSRWILANYHRPAWPAVKSPSAAKYHWVPLFEKYQVDLVFESDGHTLKKTVPIWHKRRDPVKGIVYVGEGGLGVRQRKPKHKDKWYFQAPGFATSKHHIQLLKVESNKMDFEIYDIDYELYNRVEFLPKDRTIPDKYPRFPKYKVSGELFNRHNNTCLSMKRSKGLEYAVNVKCSPLGQKNIEFVPQTNGYYKIVHKTRDLCLTYSNEKILFYYGKVFWDSCNNSAEQTFRLDNFQNSDFLVKDMKYKNCLHFSRSMEVDDTDIAYHKSCSMLKQKELFVLQM